MEESILGNNQMLDGELPQENQQMNIDVYMYRLQNNDILTALEHQLRGEVLEDKVWVKRFKSWANEEGISKMMGILTSTGLNKNITLGTLDHKEIYERCKKIWKQLALMMCVNYYQYGIDRGNRSMLIQMIIQQIHSALSRSEMGREAKQLSGTTQRVEHTVKNERVGAGSGLIQGLFKRNKEFK